MFDTPLSIRLLNRPMPLARAGVWAATTLLCRADRRRGGASRGVNRRAIRPLGMEGLLSLTSIQPRTPRRQYSPRAAAAACAAQTLCTQGRAAFRLRQRLFFAAGVDIGAKVCIMILDIIVNSNVPINDISSDSHRDTLRKGKPLRRSNTGCRNVRDSDPCPPQRPAAKFPPA